MGRKRGIGGKKKSNNNENKIRKNKHGMRSKNRTGERSCGT
jgi:hypothetical protein